MRWNTIWRETVASHTCSRTDHSVRYDTRCLPLFHAKCCFISPHCSCTKYSILSVRNFKEEILVRFRCPISSFENWKWNIFSIYNKYYYCAISFQKMSNITAGIPVSVLDDCCLRFLVRVKNGCHSICYRMFFSWSAISLQGELDSDDFKDSVRVFFKIEEAHWFYLDHFCESNPILPKVPLRDFCAIVCNHFPQLHRFVEFMDEYWKTWKQYKASIPTAGAILLDETLEYVGLLLSVGALIDWSIDWLIDCKY